MRRDFIVTETHGNSLFTAFLVGRLVMPLSLQGKEADLVERYQIIEDRHERLNAITSRSIPGQILVENEKSDALLVQGCVSRVWLRVVVVDGALKIHFAAESALLRGLVGLLAELYDGASACEAAELLPHLLESLELDRMLSPTRLNGLSAVVQKIQNAAREADVDRRS